MPALADSVENARRRSTFTARDFGGLLGEPPKCRTTGASRGARFADPASAPLFGATPPSAAYFYLDSRNDGNSRKA